MLFIAMLFLAFLFFYISNRVGVYPEILLITMLVLAFLIAIFNNIGLKCRHLVLPWPLFLEALGHILNL